MRLEPESSVATGARIRSRGKKLFAMLAIVLPTIVPGAQAASAQPSVRPSFDCSRASTRVEKMICHDPSLAAADALMAKLFAATKISSFGEGPSNMVSGQRQWIKDRSAACKGLNPAKQPACLLNDFNERNEELAVAALFAEPELALSTLRSLDPAAAPLLEAVHLYALERPGSDWRSPAMSEKRVQLLQLLQPYADRLRTEEGQSYGRDILKDSNIESADDALKSDGAFAMFVGIASAYIPDGPVPRPLPCAALVRNPNLIAMEEPRFGSTLDNFIVSADCPETLPPAPQLLELVDQINNHWPTCEGTIRFAAYRTFGRAVDEALLGTGQKLPKGRSARVPSLTGVSRQKVEAAVTELTAYYQRYRRAPEQKARALATSSVRTLMDTGHNCD